jgi:hypothetical protein
MVGIFHGGVAAWLNISVVGGDLWHIGHPSAKSSLDWRIIRASFGRFRR